MPLERPTAANGKCRATTKAGRQCAAPLVRGGTYCALRSDPKKAAELGRKRGKANRHTFETPSQEVAPPESVGDVKRMLAQTMANVLAGKTDPKLGTTVAYMGIALLRVYEADPPVPPEKPSIYTALQYRITRSPVTAEEIQQKQLLAPGSVLEPALHAQTEKVEVAPREKEFGDEILDLP